MARFMARPWGPPNSGSHAMTRLMAGGTTKSWANHSLDSSNIFRAGSGYSEASRSLTVGMALLLEGANDRPGRIYTRQPAARSSCRPLLDAVNWTPPRAAAADLIDAARRPRQGPPPA